MDAERLEECECGEPGLEICLYGQTMGCYCRVCGLKLATMYLGPEGAEEFVNQLYDGKWD